MSGGNTVAHCAIVVPGLQDDNSYMITRHDVVHRLLPMHMMPYEVQHRADQFHDAHYAYDVLIPFPTS